MTELNRDFYNQVRQDHEELLEWLGRVHQALAQRSDSAEQLVDLLEGLGQHIERHFVDEESGGFFEQVVEQAPRFSERADALRREHERLRAQMAELIAAGRAGGASDAWWQQLNDTFHEFSRSLMQHENRENELLQEAYGEDVGSKD